MINKYLTQFIVGISILSITSCFELTPPEEEEAYRNYLAHEKLLSDPILKSNGYDIKIPINGNHIVSFKSYHNRFFTSDNNGGGDVKANRIHVGDWEKFYIVKEDSATSKFLVHGDKVRIMSGDKRHYLSAEENGRLVATRTSPGDWESFTIINITNPKSDIIVRDGDTIALRTHHNKYVVAEDNGAVNANRSSIGAWEQFRLFYHHKPWEKIDEFKGTDGKAKYIFSAILASDPQAGYNGNLDNGKYNSFKNSILKLVNDKSYINATSKVVGVVMNGDLTNASNVNSQKDLSRDFINAIRQIRKVWIGFGNHDWAYYGSMQSRRYLLDQVNYLKNEIESTMDLVFADYLYQRKVFSRLFQGSFGYAWDINVNANRNYFNVRFIQLNDYPHHELEIYELWSGLMTRMKITKSLNWLDKVLSESKDKHSVFINFHQPAYADNKDFVDIIKKYDNVRAIFTGHTHRVGKKDEIDAGTYKIPVFENGGSDTEQYMAMKLFSDKMHVYNISSKNGNVDVISCGKVDLETGKYSNQTCSSTF